MACFDGLASDLHYSTKPTYAGSIMTGGFNVEFPFIHPRSSALSWLVHSTQEWAETAETMAAVAAMMFFISIDVFVMCLRVIDVSRERKSL